jgi:hypothetical protein
LDGRLGRSARTFVACFFRAVDRDGDNVMPDGELVAVAKPVRRMHPIVGTVQERAIGGNVV